MNCMKCGREIQQGQVFCPDCLEDMEKYPVKPGTVVQLPARPKQAPVKKPNRRRTHTLAPEEQVPRLRRHIRWLRLFLLMALAALALTGWLFVQELYEDGEVLLPGQNYATEAPDDPT